MSIDPALLKRVSALFDEFETLSPAARAPRLALLHADEPVVAAELQRWLAQDQSASGALDRLLQSFQKQSAAAELEAEEEPPSDRSGQQIGAYQLLRRVGRGGMGEVYEARRPGADFEQRVAVKLLRRGLDSADIVRRFLRERRILAQLEHPGIARLVDGGLSADGLPYLVMEFVDGRTLIEGAHALDLDLPTRLQLFLKICDAVAYAHRRLIVHRDLKPSNVLLSDEREVKLLDFGIAKLLDASENTADPDGDHDGDALTHAGMRVLTPAYAAPEQILGQPVSTATDVYALGVMLHELLTGRLPHARRGKSLDRVVSELDQEILLRPSAAMLDGADPSQITQRKARQLQGDLDTIILHALKREPERRYAGAAELAADLRRYLDGRPVHAEHDTLVYRMRKFIKRHRAGVSAAVLAVLGILVGLVLALWQAERAQAQAERADAEARRAQQQAARAEHVKEFVLALFREQSPLTRERSRAASASSLIARGIAQAQHELAGDPQLQAQLIGELAELQFGLGEVQDSVVHLHAALKLHQETSGVESTAYASTQAVLASAWLSLGETEKAAEVLPGAVQTLERTAGPDSLETAQAQIPLLRLLLLQNRLSDALPLARHTHAVFARERGAHHVNTLQRQFNVAVVLEQLDQLEDAERILREVIEGYQRSANAQHVQLIYPRTTLAMILSHQRKYEEAAQLLADALSAAHSELDPAHPLIGTIAMHLGDLQRRQRRYDEAESYWQTAERIFSPLGATELGFLWIYRGGAALEQRQFDAAISHYEQAVAHYERTLGVDNVYTYSARLRLVKAWAMAGQTQRAQREGAPVYHAMLAAAEAGTWDEAHAHEAWAEAMDEAAAWSAAQVAYRKALDVQRTLNGADHVNAAHLEVGLAQSLHAGGGTATEIAELLKHAIAVLQPIDSTSPSLGTALLLRGQLMQHAGELAAARQDWQLAQQILRESFVEHHPHLQLLVRLLAESE